MKKLISLLLLTMLVVSCGKDSDGGGGSPGPTGGDNTPYVDIYTSVGRVEITVGVNENAASIVYVSPTNDTFAIDEAQIVPVLSGDTLTLDLGDVAVTALSTNRTKICGGGNVQCTSAIIRAYSTEVVGFTGVAGFVNKTDGYGVDVLIEDDASTSPDNIVGLAGGNAITLQSYVITHEKKINLTHFPSASYAFEADFSNAGAGSYEMTIVIELALGL